MMRILTIAIVILSVIGLSQPTYYYTQSPTEATSFSTACTRASLLPIGNVPTSPLPRHCQIGEDQDPYPHPQSSTSPITGITPD